MCAMQQEKALCVWVCVEVAHVDLPSRVSRSLGVRKLGVSVTNCALKCMRNML